MDRKTCSVCTQLAAGSQGSECRLCGLRVCYEHGRCYVTHPPGLHARWCCTGCLETYLVGP